MEWTLEKPTVHGYYWLKVSDHHVAEVVLVTFDKLYGPHLNRFVYRFSERGLSLDDPYLANASWCGLTEPIAQASL